MTINFADALEAANSDFNVSAYTLASLGALLTEEEKKVIILRFLNSSDELDAEKDMQQLFYDFQAISLALSIGMTHKMLQELKPAQYSLESVIKMHLKEDAYRGSSGFQTVTDVLGFLDGSSTFFGIRRSLFDENDDYAFFELLMDALAIN